MLHYRSVGEMQSEYQSTLRSEGILSLSRFLESSILSAILRIQRGLFKASDTAVFHYDRPTNKTRNQGNLTAFREAS
jgi:hypothetical protein